MVGRVRGIRWLVIGLLALGACRPGAPAKPGKPASPLAFEPFRQGLPTGRIWKSQLKFGDVNGDGVADLAAVSRLADGPYVWLSDGKGGWKDASSGLPREIFCGGGVAFGDINKDGKTDLTIADHCKGVYAFFGDGAGNWTNASSGLPTVGSEDVALGDVDNDGCLDIGVVTAQEEGIRVYKGNCKGTWREISEGLPHTEWGNGFAFADMNGDKNMDVVAAYAAGPRVYLGDGKGKWREASEGLPAPEIHGLYWGVAVGDVNNDGKPDIATGAAIPGVEVFIQEEGGKYRNSSQGIAPMNALGVAFGDLDKDGNLDLVAMGKTNLEEIGGVYGVHLFKGDGQGHWTYMEGTGLPSTGRERTWGVALGDVNGDGVLDIAAAFGDVLPPTWRSGSMKKEGDKAKPGDKKDQKREKEKAKAKETDAGKDAPKSKGPDRGRFGSIEVWAGHLTGR